MMVILTLHSNNCCRAVIELTLDLNGTDLISGYEPNAARLVHGCVPVSIC
jgi:hypothetical protein